MGNDLQVKPRPVALHSRQNCDKESPGKIDILSKGPP